MLRQLLTLALALCVVTSICSAKYSKTQSKDSKSDRSKKSIPSSKTAPAAKAPTRYNPAAERIKFFTDASKDNELDAGEFNSSRSRGDGFVRREDSWSTMLRFDKDGNKTIDWFEADAYRRSQYITTKVQITTLGGTAVGGTTNYAGLSKEQLWKALTGKYDRDGNGRLEGEEKSHAYREYKQIREQQEREERAKREREKQARESSQSGTQSTSPSSPKSSASQIWAELTKKYDRDGNGKLEGEERSQAISEYKRIRYEQSKRDSGGHDKAKYEKEKREKYEKEKREKDKHGKRGR